MWRLVSGASPIDSAREVPTGSSQLSAATTCQCSLAEADDDDDDDDDELTDWSAATTQAEALFVTSARAAEATAQREATASSAPSDDDC